MKRLGILVATVVAVSGATVAVASAHGGSARDGLTPASSNHLEPGDDKGGLRPRGVSDDPPGHDAGDDKGGLRPRGVSDDPPGDDHGGHNSGPGSGRSGDDGPGDDHGGHGSDDGPGHH